MIKQEPDTIQVVNQSQPLGKRKFGISTTWDPNTLLSITIEPNNSECFGEATPTSQRLFSSACGEVTQCHGEFIFNIWFYVDIEQTPRPSPFTRPKLTLNIKFTNDDGVVKFQKQGTDSNPNYQGAGDPLKPNFGTRFTINSNKNGKLEVKLKLEDSDTGKTVSYSDTIICTKDCS